MWWVVPAAVGAGSLYALWKLPGMFDQQKIMLAYPQAGPELALSIVTTARNLGMNPAWLANLINLETGGTFDPAIVNKGSGATGLIQFMPRVASKLGTSASKLAKMSGPRQMKWVQFYFEKVSAGNYTDPYTGKRYPPGPLHTKQAVYMTVFYPDFRYSPPDTEMPDRVKRANPGVNTVNDYIRALDANSKM